MMTGNRNYIALTLSGGGMEGKTAGGMEKGLVTVF